MATLLSELRHNPLLWLLVLVPVVFVAEALEPEAHTLLFVLSVLAIVPLATLLSHATESVAAKTGDTVGGLLNATLGNLTEMVRRRARLDGLLDLRDDALPLTARRAMTAHVLSTTAPAVLLVLAPGCRARQDNPRGDSGSGPSMSTWYFAAAAVSFAMSGAAGAGALSSATNCSNPAGAMRSSMRAGASPTTLKPCGMLRGPKTYVPALANVQFPSHTKATSPPST